MKYLLFTIFLSLGCSAADGKVNDDTGVGTNDTNQKTDVGTQDVGDFKMGLDIPDCFFIDTFDEERPKTLRKHHILIGENTEKEVSFTMALCQTKVGVGESWIYRIDYFSVTWKGEEYPIATKDLKYINSHHNWFDSLEARTSQADFDWVVQFHNESRPEFIHKLSGKVGEDVLDETIMDVQCDNCRNFEFVL